MHPGVTMLRVLKGADRAADYIPTDGICIHCGCDTPLTDPYIRGKECWVCGRFTVYGVAELLMEMCK